MMLISEPDGAIPMNAAIFYSAEAYSTAIDRLMGRNAAGESFLKGYLRHGIATEFSAQVASGEDATHFAQAVAASGRQEPVNVFDQTGTAALEKIGTLYFPGPDLGALAWRRGLFGHDRWSLCGITHTTASARAMDSIVDMLTAPVQPWDALICTSVAVKENVVTMFEAQGDYLSKRLGASRFVLPETPVIPLGVDVNAFKFSKTQKAMARKAIGAGEDEIIVLYLGRLSPHAKAHPLAMYQALEAAKRNLGRDQAVTLVECGWFANDILKQAYDDAAALACPSVRRVVLDGRSKEHREAAWASADIFCSLADNIQETFGITPLEAMAAGLPVVVSDWNGYRDSVRDGVEGFLIPTTLPPPGLGGDLAFRHALEIDGFDMYVGHTCSFTAVDLKAATAAFEKLFTSAEQRRMMGEAGQARAANYDWSVIISRYEALWERLKDVRNSANERDSKMPVAWPARLDPYRSFQGYATQTLSSDTKLGLSSDHEATKSGFAQLRRLLLVSYNTPVASSEEELDLIFRQAAKGVSPAFSLVEPISDARKAIAFRSLTWLLKIGVLQIVRDEV